ncbi:transmembrane protein 176B-like [Dendropsophus ebraccatus]|uniref:transmembrane protein 176B-like n=1 Tax=Dendropsophus ebraccatus TaxID=150705 RepID=UPI0038316BBD
MTATSTVKTKDGNVSCETPEGTAVHININQRSAFDCLLDTFKVLQDMKKSGPKIEPSRLSGPGSHLGFGVAYIPLGLIFVILAIIINVVHPDWKVFYSGVYFWVGFPFLVSGALNLLAFKHPNKILMAFAFISLVVNFGVSIAGVVISSNDVDSLKWRSFDGDNICTSIGKSQRNYWDSTRAPIYQNNYEYDYNLDRCKDGFRRFENLQTGFIILNLLLMIWALCLSILSVGCRLRSCFRSCTLPRIEEEDTTPLIKPVLADNIIIA